MKPQKKPFVVEIKNRRRQFRRENSIWGNIDLTSASSKLASEQTGEDSGAAVPVRQPETSAKPNATDISA